MSQDTSSMPAPDESELNIHPIATISSDFKEKFGTPRQAGLCPSVKSAIVLENNSFNREAILGLADFSHIWILAWFHKNKDQKPRSLVRPPRLGGNTKVGVYSTRSPYRPNPISLSACQLLEIEIKDKEIHLKLAGCDLIHGTPVLDIKPYIGYADSKPESLSGWAARDWPVREVTFSEQAQPFITTQGLKEALCEVLCQDPRPAYQRDSSGKSYTFSFRTYEVTFCARQDGSLLVERITPLKSKLNGTKTGKSQS